MRSLSVGLCAVALWVAAPGRVSAVNVRPGVPEGPVTVHLDIVVQYNPSTSTEFTPIDIEPFNDGTGRLAVSTYLGTIRVINGSDQLVAQPLLTSTQSALVPGQEAGMTGIAFHPDFNSSGTFGHGKLYTIVTERRESQGGVPNAQVDFPFTNENHQVVIREWNLATFGNVPGNAANGQFTGSLANSRELLRIDRPGPFHSVADLGFNTHAGPGDPDYGLLYINSGDGGNPAGMTTAQASTFRAMQAQDLSTIYGNVLRIDPDPTRHALVRSSANTGQPAYSIPTSNPYNGDDATETRISSTLAEIWAHGFRSPYRITFDRGTGDLYLGDVGENAREEVNRVVAGANYGWGQVEGTIDSPFIAGDGTLLPGLTPPLVELTSTDSNSVIGGFVYRGAAIPSLRGKYVFGDLGQGFATGALFYAIVDPDDPSGDVGDVFEFQLTLDSDDFVNASGAPIVLPTRIFAFGEDEDGEIYFTAGPDPRNPPPNPPLPSYIVRLGGSGILNGIVGDVDQNGVLDPIVDVDAFVLGWKTTGHVGDIAKYNHGDLNLDGRTSLADAFILHQALAALGAAFPFHAIGEVPEPPSVAMGLLALGAAGAVRRRATRGRRL